MFGSGDRVSATRRRPGGRVEALLGRRVQGAFEVVVRHEDGSPVVLRNAPVARRRHADAHTVLAGGRAGAHARVRGSRRPAACAGPRPRSTPRRWPRPTIATPASGTRPYPRTTSAPSLGRRRRDPPRREVPPRALRLVPGRRRRPGRVRWVADRLDPPPPVASPPWPPLAAIDCGTNSTRLLISRARDGSAPRSTARTRSPDWVRASTPPVGSTRPPSSGRWPRCADTATPWTATASTPCASRPRRPPATRPMPDEFFDAGRGDHRRAARAAQRRGGRPAELRRGHRRARPGRRPVPRGRHRRRVDRAHRRAPPPWRRCGRSTSAACASPSGTSARTRRRPRSCRNADRRGHASCSTTCSGEVPQMRDARHARRRGRHGVDGAAVELGLLEYDRDAIHHFRLTHAAAEDVFRTLATETARRSVAQPRARAGPRRRDRRRLLRAGRALPHARGRRDASCRRPTSSTVWYSASPSGSAASGRGRQAFPPAGTATSLAGLTSDVRPLLRAPRTLR